MHFAARDAAFFVRDLPFAEDGLRAKFIFGGCGGFANVFGPQLAVRRRRSDMHELAANCAAQRAAYVVMESFRTVACGERNDANAVAGLRGAEVAARTVLRTAIFTRVSLTRGRSDFGKRAAAATERKESENVFDKPRAEPNLLGLCRGEKTSA